jgi:hypothetical protein
MQRQFWSIWTYTYLTRFGYHSWSIWTSGEIEWGGVVTVSHQRIERNRRGIHARLLWRITTSSDRSKLLYIVDEDRSSSELEYRGWSICTVEDVIILFLCWCKLCEYECIAMSSSIVSSKVISMLPAWL